MLLLRSKWVTRILLRLRFFAAALVDNAADILIRQREIKYGVALIRLDAIGDFVLWLDTAKEYARIFPNQKITLIANAAWADLARAMPYWESVWPIEMARFGRSLRYRWQTLSRIREAGFAVAVQPTYSRVFLHGDSIIRASGAVERIGSAGDLSNMRSCLKVLADRWYTTLVAASVSPLMELERNAEFLSNLAGTPYQAAIPLLPKLTTLPQHLQPMSPYFIVFPGVSWSGKQWPAGNFAKVLCALYRTHGWLPVLCGAPHEEALCQAIATASSVKCLNLAGHTSLVELAEVIRGANLLVGNDTSAVHLAAAVATPAVCILGGGHYGRFMPYPDATPGVKPVAAAKHMACYHCNWRCHQPHGVGEPVPCVAEVTVEQVMACCDLALSMVATPNVTPGLLPA